MGPIEIITIVVAVAIVAGVIIASIVRKIKGKPSLGCDCAGCSKAKECDGSCCGGGEVDWSEIVKQHKQVLDNNQSSCTCEHCKQADEDANNK